MTVLRAEVLRGRSIRVAGSVSDEVQRTLSDLGASLERPGEPAVQALVHDASRVFAESGLTAALEDAWVAIAAAANDALIPAGRGKIVLIAPRAGTGPYVEAARAGLENLARTLSVEWARYGITTTAVTPGPSTTDREIATLVAYLLSEAGDYFSGCRFELGVTG
jgi:NAD(P)-dependent dehydrogenase (short-subunit alcohol dehydrogenase family)